MTSLVTQNVDASSATDLESILRNLANRKVTEVPAKREAAPTGSAVVPVADKTVQAIARLNERLATVELPTSRRLMLAEELVSATNLGLDAKIVKKGAEDAVNAIKAAVFNHLDVELEDTSNVSDLPVDKSGHYLVEGELDIPGTGQTLSRELKQDAPTLTEQSLWRLVEQGKLPRKTYYRITKKARRNVDEEALLEELKSNPVLESVIRDAIEPGKVTAAFWIRPTKVEK